MSLVTHVLDIMIHAPRGVCYITSLMAVFHKCTYVVCMHAQMPYGQHIVESLQTQVIVLS